MSNKSVHIARNACEQGVRGGADSTERGAKAWRKLTLEQVMKRLGGPRRIIKAQ